MAIKLKKDERLGWHLLSPDRILRYSDGRKVAVGTRLTATDHGVADPTMIIRVCSRGMHASTKITNAIGYHQGPILSRVLVEGDIEVDKVEQSRKDGGGYKFAGRHRTALWMKRLDRNVLLKIAEELKLKVYATQYIGGASRKTIPDLISAIRTAKRDKRRKAEQMLTEWARANGCPR